MICNIYKNILIVIIYIERDNNYIYKYQPVYLNLVGAF